MSWTTDFGQLGYAGNAPSGYKKLSTANLPEATVKDGRKYFDTILYEGTGAGQKIGQFQPITETYSVADSALFSDNDATTLSKTFTATPSSDRQGTFSFWFKRGNINDAMVLLSQTSPIDSAYDTIYVNLSVTNQLNISMEA